MFFAMYTAQNMKFSIKDFFGKCDQIRRKLWIWSHLLKNGKFHFLCSGIESILICSVTFESEKLG